MTTQQSRTTPAFGVRVARLVGQRPDGRAAFSHRVRIAEQMLHHVGALTDANATRLGDKSARSARKLRAPARRGVSVARFQREAALTQARVYYAVARRCRAPWNYADFLAEVN